MGGIPYERLHDATLRETQLVYLAALHEAELRAQVDVELELNKLSGQQLAKAEREAEKDKDEHADADRLRGQEIVEEIRESLFFRVMAPHRKAQHIRRYGVPGQEGRQTKPYRGMRPEVALGILKVLGAGKLDKFDKFHEQVTDKMELRLKATLKVEGGK